MATGATDSTGSSTLIRRLAEKALVRAGGKDALREVDWPASIATALAFVLLFAQPFVSLASDWWNVPEAGHGLLLAPVAVWLAWRAGIRPGAAPNPTLGLAVIVVAVLVRCAAGLAAELFTMRA